MLHLFRSLIYFDLIESHLISDQVGFGSDQVSLIFFFKIRSGQAVRFKSGRIRRVLPPLQRILAIARGEETSDGFWTQFGPMRDENYWIFKSNN
jgi:hypothetical protein